MRSLAIVLLVSVLLAGVSSALAQDSTETAPPPKPCSAPEYRQFDFWLGTWDVWWESGDTIARGSNHVTEQLGKCVIQEDFSAFGSPPFNGHSVSVWNPQSGQWRQTWVDNSGGYLDFTGGWKDGKMILSREYTRNDSLLMQRMVFYNISQDTLDWKWEGSRDNGETWNVLWHINYERR